MAEHVEQVLNNAIDGLKKMIDVDSVVGNPINISDSTTVIPVSKVSMGFVSGGSSFGKAPSSDNFGGGAGGGSPGGERRGTGGECELRQHYGRLCRSEEERRHADPALGE